MANNTGTFFNVNDNDGIPLVGVSTNGKVMINHLYGNCLIGSTSVTGTASQPLQVTGGAYVSGNLGIGTTNPTVNLQVQGDGIFTGIITASNFVGSLTGTATTANNVSSTININTSGIITASSFVGGLTGIASTATTALGFSTTSSINTSGIITATGGFVGGLVGINTNTPPSVYKLQVHDSYIQITNAAEGTTDTKGLIIGYDSSEDRQLINSFTKPLVLNTAAAGTPLVLQPTAARRVGIGSTIPTNKLDVIGDTYISGNLGIGTTNPTAKLHIDGNAFRLSTSKTPASTSDSGNKGEICWDSSYIYVCVEENTWKRSSLGSW